jgi:hypothetical protein
VLAGAILWVLAELTTPLAIFFASLAFWLMMGPAISLGTSLSFAHLPSAENDFGRVRLWGTVGWVFPAWLLCAWMGSDLPASELGDAFRLGGVMAIAQGLYALTLPHTPPQRLAGAPPAPLAALRLLRGRAFAVYCVTGFGVCATTTFTWQVTPLLLAHLGIPRPWVMPTLTIAQATEVATLAILPVLLLRLGLRGTMLVGLIAWTAALAVLTVGEPLWLVVSSLTLNGLCVCCFLVAGQVFVNSQARGDIRASAQGLLSLINGLGLLAGNLFVGWVRNLVERRFPPTFAAALAITVVLIVVFTVGFWPPEDE